MKSLTLLTFILLISSCFGQTNDKSIKVIQGNFNVIGFGSQSLDKTPFLINTPILSENQLRESWLKDSISSEQLNNLANTINFNDEVIFIHSLSKHSTYSGEFTINNASLINNKLKIITSFGIYDKDCELPRYSMTPYLIVSFKKELLQPPYTLNGDSGSSTNYKTKCEEKNRNWNETNFILL